MIAALVALASAALAGAPPEVWVQAECGTAQFVERATGGSRWQIGVGATARWPAGLELEVGVRRLFSPYIRPWPGVDGFVAARAAPAFGATRPAVGLELGLTSDFDRDWGEAELNGPNLLARAQAHTDPLYMAVQVEPLRAAWGRVAVGVLEVSFGTTLPDWGRVFRYEVTWLRLGVRT